MSWKTVLKAPPFDAVRYEKEVSPRKITLTRFFADALEEPIREGINRIRFGKPAGKSRKYRGYTADLSPETFRLYEDYIKGLLVNEESFPNHRNNDLKDRVKRRLRQEYNMHDVGLSFYYPEKGLFAIRFTLTDSPEPVKEEEKMAGAVTTATPNITRVAYSQRRKKDGDDEEE